MREETKMGCVAYSCIVLVVIIFLFVTSGCATRVGQRTFEGAAVGGALGYVVGGKTGAWVGGALGGAAGHYYGVQEEDKGFGRGMPALTPLPWMEGERVLVDVRGGAWRDSLLSVVEDELRGRGAVVVASIGRSYYRRSEELGATYLVSVDTHRRGDYITITLRVVDNTNNVLRATGRGHSYYDRHSAYDSYALAARAAAMDLH